MQTNISYSNLKQEDLLHCTSSVPYGGVTFVDTTRSHTVLLLLALKTLALLKSDVVRGNIQEIR